MLRCQIGRGQYLLPLNKVLEIIRYVTPTPVPQTPPWVSGVMNLRGRVIPVMDLAVKFGEVPCVPDEWTCIVLVDVDLGHVRAPSELDRELVEPRRDGLARRAPAGPEVH